VCEGDDGLTECNRIWHVKDASWVWMSFCALWTLEAELEGQEFRAIFGYIMNLRSAWATWNCVSKEKNDKRLVRWLDWRCLLPGLQWAPSPKPTWWEEKAYSCRSKKVFLFKKKKKGKGKGADWNLGLVAHTCSPSSWEAETEGWVTPSPRSACGTVWNSYLKNIS